MLHKNPLSILHVGKADIGGGAEKVASDLLQATSLRGLRSRMAVGIKQSNNDDILLMPRVSDADCYSRWTRGWLRLADKFSFMEGRVRGIWRVLKLMRIIAQPRILLKIRRGHEDFDFPGSWHVLNFISEYPDILHCHNLHGGYFDLRALPKISHQVPTVLTLHDAWLLSGHCAHSFDCERWETGCGKCPDLALPPAIKRDATAYNWSRKKKIYEKSRLYVVTPSQWLMNKVERSMLAHAIIEARVINNGVDLNVFHPSDFRKARMELCISQEETVLLFVGYHALNNPFKDYSLLKAAFKRVSEKLSNKRVTLICIGQKQNNEHMGNAKILYVPFTKDSKILSRYYQAANCYVHASKEEVWGLTITEALACGTPVVATEVGGIPEQIIDGKTGYLVPPQDVEGMANRIIALLTNDALIRNFSANAAQDARKRFDLNLQMDAYIKWYHAIAKKNDVM
jgi:glycosyltransferase involved in cell wall biosynthesis